MSYKIVTVCNRAPSEPYYCLSEWFKSLQGVEPLILGHNPGEYGGLGSKPRLLYNAIKEDKIKESHIIFCDCFDLVFATHPDELFKTYLGIEVPFIISSEKNCFPTDLKEEYDALATSESPYKYLNSGMIIADKYALFKVLEAMDAQNIPNDYFDGEKMVNPNDQAYYQYWFLRQPVPMAMDTKQILCNTLHSVIIDELDFSGSRIKNKITDTYPCSFHLNGNAKTEGLREPILKHLGL